MDPADLITGAWWSYAVIAVVIAGSAVFPPLPSESMLVTATGLALAGHLEPAYAGMAAGAGSLAGDSAAYSVGRVAGRGDGPRPDGRVAKALGWIERREGSWLPALIAGGRFVPGGTTAVGLACGALRVPVRRFVLLALAGATVWVAYGFALAAAGRSAAPDSPWLGLAIGLVLVVVVAGVIAGVQRLRRWRTRHH